MSSESSFDIKKWVEEIVLGHAGFRSFEEHEVVVFENRDCGLADFVLRCLATPRCEGADKVLAEIQKRRDGDFDRAQSTAEALGVGPTIQEEAPEGWKIGNPDWSAGEGPYLVRPDDEPISSPRFGDRLRELVIDEDGVKMFSATTPMEAADIALALADAIDADAKESAEAFLALSRVNSRAHMEGNAEAAEWQVTLRQRIEAAVDQLRYTSLVAGTEILRDVVDHDELIAALAEIFGPAAAKESP